MTRPHRMTRKFKRCVTLVFIGLVAAFALSSVWLVGYHTHRWPGLVSASIGHGVIELGIKTNAPDSGNTLDCVTLSPGVNVWRIPVGWSRWYMFRFPELSDPGAVIFQDPSGTGQPTWSRTLTIPLWMLLAAMLVPMIHLWRMDRRPPPGHCPRCRYNLTGNTTGVCPECGQPVPPPSTRPKH